jgi:phosphoglucosamine mutase
MLEGVLMAGLCAAGVDVCLAGVIPTPAVAYLAKHMDTCAGVMISASHNPAPDNGIKFFNHQGFKLDDQLEDAIEAMILEDFKNMRRPVGAGVGKVMEYPEGVRQYVQFLKTKMGSDLTGLSIVVDCANGAASLVAPQLFRELGAQVVSIFDQPDGVNINDGCGSTHLDGLRKAVVRYQADLGLAFDGDADRLLLADAQGQLVDGDQIMMILALELERLGILGGQAVATVMSNLGLREAMKRAGIRLHETKVGDRYVLEKMIEEKAVFGGEQSGHIIYLKENTTGDGIFTALMLLKHLQDTRRPLRELAEQMDRRPQVLVNVGIRPAVDWAADWETYPEVLEAVRAAEAVLGESGRLLVRASGTEPVVRVMAEGPDQAQIRELVHTLTQVIGRHMGEMS